VTTKAAAALRTPPPPLMSETLVSGQTTKYKMQNISLAQKIYNRIGLLGFNMFVTYIPSHFIRQTWMRLFGAKIGKDSSILRGTTVFDLQYLTIGDSCSIGFRCVLDARAGISIGDNVVIASDAQILGGGHDINDPDFLPMPKPTVIEDYVWIGTLALILPCTIGRGAVVAGMSMVNKNVGELEVVGGNPAKPFAKRDPEALKYSGKFRPMFY
jgi:acetyltransferase-like isoleucine patch superfamily enzyme